MQLAAAVDRKRLRIVPKKRNREGSRAGEKSAEGKEEGKKKMYTDDKHAICCKMLCLGSSLVCP